MEKRKYRSSQNDQDQDQELSCQQRRERGLRLRKKCWQKREKEEKRALVGWQFRMISGFQELKNHRWPRGNQLYIWTVGNALGITIFSSRAFKGEPPMSISTWEIYSTHMRALRFPQTAGWRRYGVEWNWYMHENWIEVIRERKGREVFIVLCSFFCSPVELMMPK